MEYPYDLGTYARKITTTSPEAQRWFDRGLNWCFGYHHEEAAACFKKALEIDPNCAMAHWGVAYAVGPNYNFPWELQDPAGKATFLPFVRMAGQGEEVAAVARCEGGLPEKVRITGTLDGKEVSNEIDVQADATAGQGTQGQGGSQGISVARIETERQKRIEREALEDPAVKAAMEILGGKVDKIQRLDE